MTPPPSPNKSSLSLELTPQEVTRLLEDKTSAVRLDITEKIAGAYGHNQLNEKEKQAAEQVFRLLVRDTEVRIRATLASHIKDSESIPHDIVMPLARDVAEVSLPVLQYSQVLNDDDLLDLIGHTHEISRYVAISRRKEVSDMVTGTLLDKGSDAVAAALVENPGAKISETGITKIVENFRDNEVLMKAVADRPHLPVAAAEKLIHVVSASLAESLKEKYKLQKLPTDHIEKEVDKAHEGETLKLVHTSKSQDDIDKLVHQLHASGRLTPSLILSSLCQGDFPFFETSLAKLSDIPVVNARKLIADRGELGFRAIYNKSGLPDAMFPAVKMLLKVMRELDAEGEKPDSRRYANRVVERLLQYAEETPVENLSYIIALVRQISQ